MKKAQRIQRAACPNSPTGSHWFTMQHTPTRYWGRCLYCAAIREEDPLIEFKGPTTVMLEGSHQYAFAGEDE